MKTITLGFCLAILACGIASASEVQHAAIVDMPKVITLNHASPDSWYTLPAVQPDAHKPTAAYNLREPLVFRQLGRLELTCSAESTYTSRNRLSLVKFP
jgi:hypothetical protein